MPDFIKVSSTVALTAAVFVKKGKLAFQRCRLYEYGQVAGDQDGDLLAEDFKVFRKTKAHRNQQRLKEISITCWCHSSTMMRSLLLT